MTRFKPQRFCSNKTYNFFGDVDILVSIGEASIEDAINVIKEVYDKNEWNGWEKPHYDKFPPMYKTK